MSKYHCPKCGYEGEDREHYTPECVPCKYAAQPVERKCDLPYWGIDPAENESITTSHQPG